MPISVLIRIPSMNTEIFVKPCCAVPSFAFPLSPPKQWKATQVTGVSLYLDGTGEERAGRGEESNYTTLRPFRKCSTVVSPHDIILCASSIGKLGKSDLLVVTDTCPTTLTTVSFIVDQGLNMHIHDISTLDTRTQ